MGDPAVHFSNNRKCHWLPCSAPNKKERNRHAYILLLPIYILITIRASLRRSSRRWSSRSSSSGGARRCSRRISSSSISVTGVEYLFQFIKPVPWSASWSVVFSAGWPSLLPLPRPPCSLFVVVSTCVIQGRHHERQGRGYALEAAATSLWTSAELTTLCFSCRLSSSRMRSPPII